MPEIIIYSGSFNPVHNGHTAVAQYVAEAGLCDEVWMVVSPQNPHKQDLTLAPEGDRLEMARIAVREQSTIRNVKVSDLEFELPRPSYTINTLQYLSAKFPGTRFSLLIGTDIIPSLHRWKNWQFLVNNCRIYVYPRKGTEFEQIGSGMIYLGGAPCVDVSSTGIRAALEEGGDLTGMLSRGVINYIYDKGLWVADAAQRRKDTLDKMIGQGGAGAQAYLERGRLLYRRSQYGEALNDFLQAGQLDPDNPEAREYIRMLRDIFEYRNMDIYNP